MIRLLTGQPEPVSTDALAILVHGVGYEVFVGPRTRQALVVQDAVTVHVYTHVREDQFQLYGFLSGADREMFIRLLSVSGVGPRSAMMIIDNGVSAVVKALQTSDVAFFQSVPRLGKKTAQKIIVELQSKVGSIEELNLSPENSMQQDLRVALLNMGYNEARVDQLVREVDDSFDIAQALKWSLQQFSRGNETEEKTRV
jgi:Holliday junction DNA helicase RuvA